eukprot:TRINITY_DN2665_c0_g2_i1.p2 TRINITY_DN2665_c0_g2~~TRINITY_DN2665_c0_g2_i1.p2  ORF type:complete len:314 (+),score=4.26 TRINITY_DN2665_c0_g2_i1:165-1106(+)
MIRFASLFFIVIFSISVVQNEDTCDDTFNKKSRSTYFDVAKMINNQICKRGVYCHKEASQREDLLYFINGSEPGQQFIICTTPKSGVTRTKQLLSRILGIRKKIYHTRIDPSIYQQSQYNPLTHMSDDKINDLLQNPDIPRFIFVRNPFVRALSMYNDKLYLMDSLSRKATFNTFIEELYSRQFQFVKRINKHFVQQSKLCRLDVGMTYDYTLKIEEIDDWFDCFVDMVNIRDVVMHGWPGDNDCYLSTTKTPCNGPHVTKNLVKFDNGTDTTKHVTGSANMVDQIYQNTTLAQMVAAIFKEDFIKFNYSFRP